MDLRSVRNTFKISQSRLARLSGVSRFKICLFELGDGPLSVEEESQIRDALRREAKRVRTVALKFEADPLMPSSAQGVSGV